MRRMQGPYCKKAGREQVSLPLHDPSPAGSRSKRGRTTRYNVEMNNWERGQMQLSANRSILNVPGFLVLVLIMDLPRDIF